jgi:hypothetical protein
MVIETFITSRLQSEPSRLIERKGGIKITYLQTGSRTANKMLKKELIPVPVLSPLRKPVGQQGTLTAP